MRESSAEQAIILYGPPGAGKGTQAELLARAFHFVHFDTGRYLKHVLFAPNADATLKRKREQYQAGELVDPAWVLSLERDKVLRIAQAGLSLVLSGSPRTPFEAFGDAEHQGLLPALAEQYGEENIHLILLRVPADESLTRNASRLICSVCGLPMMGATEGARCNFCGGKGEKRPDDNPETIKHRLEVYTEEIVPLIGEMRDYGIIVTEIDGTGYPYEVHERVKAALGLTHDS